VTELEYTDARTLGAVFAASQALRTVWHYDDELLDKVKEILGTLSDIRINLEQRVDSGE